MTDLNMRMIKGKIGKSDTEKENDGERLSGRDRDDEAEQQRVPEAGEQNQEMMSSRPSRSPSRSCSVF